MHSGQGGTAGPGFAVGPPIPPALSEAGLHGTRLHGQDPGPSPPSGGMGLGYGSGGSGILHMGSVGGGYRVGGHSTTPTSTVGAYGSGHLTPGESPLAASADGRFSRHHGSSTGTGTTTVPSSASVNGRLHAGSSGTSRDASLPYHGGGGDASSGAVSNGGLRPSPASYPGMPSSSHGGSVPVGFGSSYQLSPASAVGPGSGPGLHHGHVAGGTMGSHGGLGVATSGGMYPPSHSTPMSANSFLLATSQPFLSAMPPSHHYGVHRGGYDGAALLYGQALSDNPDQAGRVGLGDAGGWMDGSGGMFATTAQRGEYAVPNAGLLSSHAQMVHLVPGGGGLVPQGLGGYHGNGPAFPASLPFGYYQEIVGVDHDGAPVSAASAGSANLPVSGSGGATGHGAGPLTTGAGVGATSGSRPPGFYFDAGAGHMMHPPGIPGFAMASPMDTAGHGRMSVAGPSAAAATAIAGGRASGGSAARSGSAASFAVTGGSDGGMSGGYGAAAAGPARLFYPGTGGVTEFAMHSLPPPGHGMPYGSMHGAAPVFDGAGLASFPGSVDPGRDVNPWGVQVGTVVAGPSLGAPTSSGSLGVAGGVGGADGWASSNSLGLSLSDGSSANIH